MTIHQLYLKYGPSLGCTHFAAFCDVWPKVCDVWPEVVANIDKVRELLNAPARIEVLIDGQWAVSSNCPMPLHQCLTTCLAQPLRGGAMRRVTLLDGTVIRWWY